jgi:hypothetical protein
MTTHHDELYGVAPTGGPPIRVAVHATRERLTEQAHNLAAAGWSGLEILPCRACDPESLPLAA